MYPKGRKRFTVAGDSPYLAMVRDHLIAQGWYLLPWINSADADLALLGVDLNNEHTHMPLAQIEMMLMGTYEVENIVLLSSPHLTVPNPSLDRWDTEARATWLYAKCAEHAFIDAYGNNVLSIRPVNVFGPDLDNYFSDLIKNARNGNLLVSPARLDTKDNFLYQDDFLDAFMFLLDQGISYPLDLSGGEMTYRNLLRNVWKFIHGADEEPEMQGIDNPVWAHQPKLERLSNLKWKPKYSVRSGLFEAVK